MDKDDLKKFLAGLCIVTLLSGTSLSVIGCDKAGTNSGDQKKDSAGSTQPKKPPGKSG